MDLPWADDGRDVRVAVSGGWLWRGPRTRHAEQRLHREATLLAWLAPQVSLRVPQPELYSTKPLRVRHRPVPGSPWRPGPKDAKTGAWVGAFLAELHALCCADAVAAGALDAETIAERDRCLRDHLARSVVPQLEKTEQPRVLAALMRLVGDDADAAMTHGDLRAAHVRCDAEGPGVIDWLDAGIGDRAKDLAWALYGSSPEFASGVRSTYPDVDAFAPRAADWFTVLTAVPPHAAG